jgi:hypothetical protein
MAMEEAEDEGTGEVLLSTLTSLRPVALPGPGPGPGPGREVTPVKKVEGLAGGLAQVPAGLGLMEVVQQQQEQEGGPLALHDLVEIREDAVHSGACNEEGVARVVKVGMLALRRPRVWEPLTQAFCR